MAAMTTNPRVLLRAAPWLGAALVTRLFATSQDLRARRADAAMAAELRTIPAQYDQLFEESPP